MGISSVSANTENRGFVEQTSTLIEAAGNWYDQLGDREILGNTKNVTEAGHDFEGRLAKRLSGPGKGTAMKWLVGSKIAGKVLEKPFQRTAQLLDATTGILGVCRAYAQEKATGKTLYAGTLFQICSTVLQTSVGAWAGAAAMAGLGAAGAGVILPAVAGTAAFAACGYFCGKIVDAARGWAGPVA